MAPELGPIATSGSRLGAGVLDTVLLVVACTPLNPWLYSNPPSAALFQSLWAVSIVLVLVYFVAFDGGDEGATPGKRILGIRVVDEFAAGPIGYRRAARRRLVYVLGGFALYVGWIWALFDPRRQTWHDKAARTLVVRVG